MTISYEWKFQLLEMAPSYQGLSDVIRTVHWRYVGTEDEAVYETFGQQPLNDPDPANFTAANEVTSDQVLGWVSALIGTEGVAALQTQITAQIALQKSPTLIPMQLSE